MSFSTPLVGYLSNGLGVDVAFVAEYSEGKIRAASHFGVGNSVKYIAEKKHS